ncbi:MAG TPA: HNH endonuclease signature motif containing protein [Bryobacteraceae bacterium]|jgi:5-methylcytosine-specific restriction endonuclease McrA
MADLDAALREFVRSRANGLCEYCRIREQLTLAEHEIDHVIAIKHGGQTTVENLASVARSATVSKAATLLR